MITLAIPKKHICMNPELFQSTWYVDIGSLWQCDECGREQIFIEQIGVVRKWRYTVEIVDKRVQTARKRNNATSGPNCEGRE